MLALGLNIVVGYAGPARSRLRRVLRGRRLLLRAARLAPIRHPPAVPGCCCRPARCVAAVFGVLLGAPTLRLRGDYLAIVTLGFGEIIRIFLNNLNRAGQHHQRPAGHHADRSARHRRVRAQPHLHDRGLHPRARAQLLLRCSWRALAASIFISLRLEDSRIGRAWIAIREDELAAARDGHQHPQSETARLRHGRDLRRRLRRAVRRVPGLRQPRELHPASTRS